MPSNNDGKAKIIIKKVAGHGGHGHHGGSWKVAYADFVTAMMAFFLLMWLLNMAKPEQKAGIAEYFQKYNLFEFHGVSSGKGQGEAKVTSDATQQPVVRKGHDIDTTAGEAAAQRRDLKRSLERSLDQSPAAQNDQVMVEYFEDGVRIQIMDQEGSPIFERGQQELTENGRRLVASVAAAMAKIPNLLAIEGHTDAAAPQKGEQNHFELSSARAFVAKRLAEQNGIVTKRLVRVAGYGAAAPLVPSDPENPRNRRVSFLVYDANASLPVSTYGLLEGKAKQPGKGGG